MSRFKQIFTGSTSMLAVLLLCSQAHGQTSGNVLVNSGFEDDVMSSYGNHVNVIQNNQPTGWQFASGSDPNIVKVDGPGGQATWYGASGPDSDATHSGAGVDRQYLDIYGGSNDFYQTFVPKCSGKVIFGGYFSTRQNNRATASVRILNGAGLSGSIVGQTNSITLPPGNSMSDRWEPADFSTTVTAGQTYTFAVKMDNNANFDEGYVKFETGCGAYPPDGTLGGGNDNSSSGGGFGAGTLVLDQANTDLADLMLPDTPSSNPKLPGCCSPWDEAMLQESLKYEGTGNITEPYTLRYSPAASVNTQMEAYINYLNALDPTVTSITVHFRLWDKGQSPSSSGLGTKLGNDHYVTWTAGGSSAPSNGGGNFFNLPAQRMNINNWYRVTSGVYLNDGKEAFGKDCANNELLMNIEVKSSNKSRSGSKSGGNGVTLKTFKNGRIKSKSVSSKPATLKRGNAIKRGVKR